MENCTSETCLRQCGERPIKHPPIPLKHQESSKTSGTPGSGFPSQSTLRSGPWGLGKRLQRAKPLLLTFTSIYLEEKPSRAKKDIYNSPLSPATTETLWFWRNPGAQLMKCLLGKHLSIFLFCTRKEGTWRLLPFGSEPVITRRLTDSPSHPFLRLPRAHLSLKRLQGT